MSSSTHWSQIRGAVSLDADTYTVCRADGSRIVGAVYYKNPKPDISRLPGIVAKLERPQGIDTNWHTVSYKKLRKNRNRESYAFVDE
jgi:hypothetical protein